MHSLCTNLQVCVGGYTHQLIKVHVQLHSDLVLWINPSECANRWDCVCTHNDIHSFEHICTQSLQTGDELQEFLIDPNLTPNACLQVYRLELHHLWQMKWGSFVSHCQCLHAVNNNVHICQDACSPSIMLFSTVEMDNCLMHGNESRIQHLLDCFEGHYFIQYLSLQLCSCRWCNLFSSLLGHL